MKSYLLRAPGALANILAGLQVLKDLLNDFLVLPSLLLL